MPQLPPLRGWLYVQYTVHYDYSGNFPTIPGYSENLPDFFFDLKFISVLPHLISNRSPLALGDISYRLRLLMKPSGA